MIRKGAFLGRANVRTENLPPVVIKVLQLFLVCAPLAEFAANLWVPLPMKMAGDMLDICGVCFLPEG